MKLKIIKPVRAGLLALLLLICSLVSFAAGAKKYAVCAEESENCAIDVGREKLTVKNSALVDADGNRFNIHGIAISDSDDANMYWSKCSQTTYRLLKKEGFNTVRYTFGASLFIDLKTKKIREENIEIFDQIAKNATAIGIYIVVDLHILRTNEFSFYSSSDDYCLIGESNPDSMTGAEKADGYKEAIYTLWEEIVSRIKGSACILAYSLINEPYGGIDGSKITYTSWSDYLASGHTGSDWNTYYAEKTAAIAELQQQAKTKIRADYSEFLQTLIDKIRAIDGETTICFQRIASLCDVSANYKYVSFSDYGWSEEDRWPDITADNILIDASHLYDNALFDYKYTGDSISGVIENGDKVGVLNMSTASDVEKSTGWYSGEKQTATTTSASCTATFDIADDEQSIKLGWGAVYITNNGSSALTVTVNAMTIYKEINGVDVAIFSASTDDDLTKLKAFGQINYRVGQNDYTGDVGFIGNTLTIEAGGSSNAGGNGVQSLNLGVKAGEKVTIKTDFTLSSDSDINAEMNFQCNRTYVGKNSAGQDIISGEDAVKKVFDDAKKVSDKYGSPIYFAEFCVMSNYINDYTNYKEYTDCFVKYADEYGAGWVWHRMSEKTGVLNDNGYGAYLNTIVPYEEYKNVGFDYVIPKLMTTKSIIVNQTESINNTVENTDSADGGEGSENASLMTYKIIIVCLAAIITVNAVCIAVCVIKIKKYKK